MATSPTPTINPPRHGHHDHAKKVESYQQQLAEAERQYVAALDQLNSDYLRILDAGGQAYAQAVERAKRAYDAIDQPAKARYLREVDIASSVYESIVGPAGKELDRLSAAAKDLFDRAITPIENAYNRALSQATTSTSSMTTSTGLG